MSVTLFKILSESMNVLVLKLCSFICFLVSGKVLQSLHKTRLVLTHFPISNFPQIVFKHRVSVKVHKFEIATHFLSRGGPLAVVGEPGGPLRLPLSADDNVSAVVGLATDYAHTRARG